MSAAKPLALGRSQDVELRLDLDTRTPWAAGLIVDRDRPGDGYSALRDLDDLLSRFRARQDRYSDDIARGASDVRALVAGSRRVRRVGHDRSAARISKRAIDIVVAAAILLLAAPLIAAISLAIKTTSPGPVFFRAMRFGRGGAPFASIRFRTVALDDDAKLHPDGVRLTAIGKALRATGVDELPGLLNVLRGEMSLVGPIALPPPEMDHLERLGGQSDGALRRRWLMRRYWMRPGLTGPWVLMRDPDGHDVMRLELEYYDRWSLWLDVKILAFTVARLFRR